jgi:hypothetical protein
MKMTSAYHKTYAYPEQHATEKGGYALAVDSNPLSCTLCALEYNMKAYLTMQYRVLSRFSLEIPPESQS